jgi:transcriptional regulator with XRE-family HTH domain
MRAALANKHIGQVFVAYRHHQDHDRAISQGTLAGWLGISQPLLSRIESGKRVITDLESLQDWADALGVPANLRWFANPLAEPTV